jgi:hypothetical protein
MTGRYLGGGGLTNLAFEYNPQRSSKERIEPLLLKVSPDERA